MNGARHYHDREHWAHGSFLESSLVPNHPPFFHVEPAAIKPIKLHRVEHCVCGATRIDDLQRGEEGPVQAWMR